MKKYHQLLLLLVSIFSLSLFLIYRHEYNRLHYVLEVFNFFGQPCNFSDLQTTENVLRQHDWGPQPLWQETEVGYIYSAFLTGKIEVKALALQGDVKNVPKTCYLWFEEKKKPIIGKFKYSKIVEDQITSYFYLCTLPSIENVPYAVSFAPKSKKEIEMKKILVTNTLDHKPSVNTTICVSPTAFSKKKFIEFLSYHRLIGIDSYIFYDKDIPHRITKMINNLSNKLSLQVSFLPWNYPKSDSSLVRSVVEKDCVLRTFGQSKYVITLEINEYIVPTVAFSFDSLIRNYGEDFERLSFPVQKLCINNLSMNKPIALQNFDVVDDFNYNVVRNVVKNVVSDLGPGNVISTNAVDKAYGCINKYIRCNSERHKSKTDKSIMKFATDFTRTTLVQLLLHDKI